MGCLSYCSFHGFRCYGTRSYGQIKSRRTAVYASATSTQPLKTINYQINAQNQFTGYTQAAGTTPEGNPAPGLTPDILPLSETYTYTALNQVETVTVNLGGFSKTYAYTYYPNGLKHTYTNPEGITYTYYYNKNNQLTAVHIPGQGQLTWSDFQWLMPQTLLLPGGTKITLSYNDFLQVEERILKDPANNNVASALYEYDREHNIQRITSEQGLYSFDYDNLYRLTHADYPLDTAANDEVFAYDGVGNRTGHTRVENTGVLPVDESHGEEDEGEGETGEPEAGEHPTPPARSSTTLAYNNQNQLTQATGDTGTTVSYTYHANGHTATKTDNGTTTEYVYNHEEWLIAVKVNGTTVGEYAYNPYGMRIKKTTYANGTPTTTWYLYNDKGLAAEYDSSGTLRKEYHFHPQKTWMTDPLFQRAADNQVYYYQNDHLGTPQRLIKSNGAIVWRATYTAFGEATVDPDSSIENNLRFPGQYHDKETGLYYNYFRTYDPSIGRYLESDPIGLDGGINTYGYALQNPVRYTDPFGLTSWECVKFDLFLGPFGSITYTCTSECVNSKKTKIKIRIDTNGTGIDLGAGIMGSHGNSFNDGRGAGTAPDIDVFNGAYFEGGASGAYGIGYGYGSAAFVGSTGGAVGDLTGPAAGIGAGIGGNGGISKVVWSKELDCDDDCRL